METTFLCRIDTFIRIIFYYKAIAAARADFAWFGKHYYAKNTN